MFFNMKSLLSTPSGLTSCVKDPSIFPSSSHARNEIATIRSQLRLPPVVSTSKRKYIALSGAHSYAAYLPDFFCLCFGAVETWFTAYAHTQHINGYANNTIYKRANTHKQLLRNSYGGALTHTNIINKPMLMRLPHFARYRYHSTGLVLCLHFVFRQCV